MGAKRVVHVVGTGTLGEPVISLFLNLQHDLEVDEVTFHKNRPLLNDRMKIISLIRRGARLVAEKEKWVDFEKLGMQPTYTREEALAQATVVIVELQIENLRVAKAPFGDILEMSGGGRRQLLILRTRHAKYGVGGTPMRIHPRHTPQRPLDRAQRGVRLGQGELDDVPSVIVRRSRRLLHRLRASSSRPGGLPDQAPGFLRHAL